MKPELEKKLYEKYPKIFRQKDLSMQETCMCWGCACGDGWYDLLDFVCSQIQHHLEWLKNSGYEILPFAEEPKTEKWVHQLEFEQVKEKWGRLTIYFSGGDDHLEAIIHTVEGISLMFCENCGQRGSLRTEGWYRTLCDPCFVDRKHRKSP